MKKIFYAVAIFMIGFAMITVSSCKKKDDSLNCVLTRLISETSGVFDTTTYTYNNDKKIIGATEGTNHVLYNYFGNSVNRFSTVGLVTTRDSIVFSSSGKIKEVYSFNSSGDLTQKGIYSYDSGDKLFQLIQTEYPSLVVTINNVTYNSDGDPVTISDGVNTSTFGYDVSKSAATGDYLDVFQFLNFGGRYLFPKHLITSITHGTLTSFAYEFDANGTVSKLTITSGANININHFSFLCN